MMVTRRKFIQSAIATMGVASLPDAVLAATAGPAFDVKRNTWSAMTDPTLWAQAWAARFSNVLPHAILLPLGGTTNFTYLPDPGTRSPGSVDTYTIGAGETTWNVLGPAASGLPPTKVWGYGNYETKMGVTFPGRSIVVQRDVPIKCVWVNNLAAVLKDPITGLPVVDANGNPQYDANNPLPHILPVDQTIMAGVKDVNNAPIGAGVPIAVHHHGGDTAAEFDGGPDQWTTPLRKQVGPGITMASQLDASGTALSYLYDNKQEASMHWYHDHGEGVTRTNAYAGLAGLYIVRDANEFALTNLTGIAAGTRAKGKIPSGIYELPLVIQDRVFAADGSMSYGADPATYPIPLPTVNPDGSVKFGGANLPLPNPAPNGTPPNGQVLTFDPNSAVPPDPLTGANGSYFVDRSNPTHYPEMFGDVITVNGVAWPMYQVEPRQYRLRLLNGSDSRVYVLNFGGITFWQIGTELGFLNRPVPMRTITIAPGERADIVIDFANVEARRRGRTRVRQLIVTNSGATPFPLGAPVTPGADTIMRFDVSLPLAMTPLTKVDSGTRLRGLPVPAGQSATPTLAAATVPVGTPVRKILLGEGADQYGRITPMLGTYDPADITPLASGAAQGTNKGTQLFVDPVTERVTRGATGTATEVWEFWNSTVDAHPIHMHLVQFRVLNRQTFGGSAVAPIDPATAQPVLVEATTMSNGWSGVRLIPQNVALVGAAIPAPAGEQGWKDTVLCPPGQVTRVLVTFNRPGKYVYHCHILSHEERDMMRWFEVV